MIIQNLQFAPRKLAMMACMGMTMLMAGCSSSDLSLIYDPDPYKTPAGTDPWGFYINEASHRFGVPEEYIRAVMTMESGGRVRINGQLTTSHAGALGLMQVMPSTYRELARKYGLSRNAHDPRSNILAGTAYIKEMSELYGYPGFLAAYNCGPGCYSEYLAGRRSLPEETRNYLSKGQALVASFRKRGDTRIYTKVLPDVPTRRPEYVETVQLREVGATRSWGIQVGAFLSEDSSLRAADRAKNLAWNLLEASEVKVWPVRTTDGKLYRAQLHGLSEDEARIACEALKTKGAACITVSIQ